MLCRVIEGWYGGRGIEKWRHGTQRRGVQGGVGSKRWGTGWHWRPHSHKQLHNGQLKEPADLELDKAGFRSSKEQKEIVSHINGTIHSEFGCYLDLQTD